MRSPRSALRRAVLALALVAPLAGTSAAPLDAGRSEQVIAEMRADPALNGKHLEHTLRWKNLDRSRRDAGASAPWMLQLARWLADAGRGLVWVLGAIVLAVVAVSAWRWASLRAETLRVRAVLPPSHVNELDIRPESLPADIAAAAQALCRRGALRDALSLLYRGALSRLVHEHRVAIVAASTEGECARLASRVLRAEAQACFERLVAAWQAEVYAGRPTDASAVVALCDDFDRHFAARPTAAPAAQAA